jgi:Ran GTPase-activating protein (RanGAP) involved in mRNA processing and transport
LEKLDLSGNKCTHDAGALREAMEALPPSLTELNLHAVGLGDAGLRGVVLPRLAALPRLAYLSLAVNALGAAGFAAVAEALPSLGALETLELPHNRGAGSAGVRALAAALPRAPPSLRYLVVKDCGADAAAVALLEEAGAQLPDLALDAD